MSYYRLQPHILHSGITYDIWLVGSTPIRSGIHIEATKPPFELPADALLAKVLYTNDVNTLRCDATNAFFASELFTQQSQHHGIPFADNIQGLIALHLAATCPSKRIHEISFSSQRASQLTRLYIEPREYSVPEYAATVINAIKVRAGLIAFPVPLAYKEIFEKFI